MPAGQTQTGASGGTQSIVRRFPANSRFIRCINGLTVEIAPSASLARSRVPLVSTPVTPAPFCVRRELALISLTQTNRLHFDQTPNGVSRLHGGDRKKFPHECSIHPASYRLAQKALGYQRYQRSLCRRPSVRALSLLPCPSFQTEHKRNRRQQRGKLANENTDSRRKSEE